MNTSSTFIVFMTALFCVFFAASAGARTLIVGVDYPTIGETLKHANDGDRVEVRGGEYRERIKIGKSVHLKGVDDPVVMAPGGHIIEVTRSDVIIEGFTLRYDGPNLSSTDTAIRIVKGADRVVVRDNHMLNVMFGVWNQEGRDVRIENNTIEGIETLSTNHRGNCINLTGSQQVHVVGNRLTHCRDGIYMELCHDATVTDNEIQDSRYALHTMWVDRGVFNRNRAHDNLVGLAIMYTKHSEIKDNLSYGNRTHGILFIQSVRSEITGNTVIGNTKGIFLYNSIYNEVASNLIMNNQLGFHNWGGSEDNSIHENSFIQNEIQLKFVAGKSQEWDNNYWSDYIGWDMTGDGIGDHPYESNTLVDHILWRYPMAKVLYTSPALQMLWMLEKQFPVIDVPKVIDNRPFMMPLHAKWKEMQDQYPHTPERIYGEIEKLPHLPGERF